MHAPAPQPPCPAPPPAPSGAWNEAWAAGSVAPDSIAANARLTSDWAEFFAKTADWSVAACAQRRHSLASQLAEHGVTYNLYADTEHPQRDWVLEQCPLLVQASAWAQIERGVIQRARLLEALCADLYGAQRTLHAGLLPGALVHGSSGYLPHLRGCTPLGGRHLHVLAFDLARGPDGLWWLAAQRSQAPSGLGYVLENRLALSALYPTAFAALGVQPLVGVVQALGQSLRAAHPLGARAHVALLTPGPSNETYFEHAYLARQLGVTLVEGGDLLVREQNLYLKTLRGLVQVHALIRRLDDDWLDPLELRGDSVLGVPGLLEVVRAGKVLLANWPGAGWLESPALLGFEPGLAQALLGEPLLLPAWPTWWCGEAAAQQAAWPDLARYHLRPTHSGAGPLPAAGALGGLPPAEFAAWRSRILLDPEAWTLQAPTPLSHLPVLAPDFDGPLAPPPVCAKLQTRALMWRVFALSDGRGGWQVLPGGLARLAPAGSDDVDLQRGGSSADVWICGATRTSAPEPQPWPLPPQSRAALARQVSSRSAENLFWLGRYSERADQTVRLARLLLASLHGESAPSPAFADWAQRMAQAQALVASGAPRPADDPAGFEAALRAALPDRTHVTSVGYNLRALHLAASRVRERLAAEQWRFIDQALALFEPGGFSTSAQARERLQQASDLLAAITGAQTDRMARDDGWRLLSIGRHVERLDFCASALWLALDSGCLHTPSGFDAVLELADGTLSLRALCPHGRDVGALLALLVADTDHPRALAWVAQTLRARLARLAQCPPGHVDALAQRVADPASWPHTALGPPHDALALRALLEQLRRAAWAVSEGVTETYFNPYAAVEQQTESA